MYINPNIKNTVRVFSRQNRYDYLRYDMNENPEGLPKEFVDKVLSEVTPEFLSIYPEPDRFTRKYAEYVGKQPEQILATNGSDMAIRYLFEVFGEPGKDVVAVSPSFEMYRVNCHILGLRYVPVDYDDDFSINVDNLVNSITEKTRIVVLENPNNPIGDSFSEGDAERVIRKAEEMNALVIIDEAYHYFWPNTLLDLVDRHSNVVLLRTFSKFFSLAALRLGIIIASSEIIHFLTNAKLSFDVNSLALLFGEKLMDEKQIINELNDIVCEGKKFLLDFLEKNNYEYRNCKGNFILIHTKQSAAMVVSRMEHEKKVLVRGFSSNLLRNYIRVTIGSVSSMQLFVDALAEIEGLNS